MWRGRRGWKHLGVRGAGPISSIPGQRNAGRIATGTSTCAAALRASFTPPFRKDILIASLERNLEASRPHHEITAGVRLARKPK